MTPLRVMWRRNWLYRRLLTGKLPDHIVFYPYDALPRRLEDADAMLRGRFRFAGEAVEADGKSVFDLPPPSETWRQGLNEFGWLPALSAAGGEQARDLAKTLIGEWVARNMRYSEPAMLPQTVARRLANIFAHGRFVLTNPDMLWRSKTFVSLREQAKLLTRTGIEAPDGLPRLEVAATQVLAGACLEDSPRRLAIGLERLEEELARQILPDGGHVSRSPEALAHVYRYLVMVMDALQAIDHDVPQPVRSAHDRIAPMLRFFRHGDGALALFNGGHECDARMVAALLARDDVRGQPFAHAPHSGYQRMAAAKTLAIMDCGKPPEGIHANTAHAGALSFEFSHGPHRVVVNCGSAGPRHPRWDTALRATAAHSTVTVNDTSYAGVLGEGFVRDLIGPRLVGEPFAVETSRRETPQGAIVEGRHEGYVQDFGIVHERTLSLSPNGLSLSGVDRLVPKGGVRRPRDGISFSVRFHIHPDVRITPSQGGGILLKLPNGDGWRFRCGGAQIVTDESVYLGGETVRKAEQIVLAGTVRNEPVEIGWMFEQINLA
ncbi:MAG: heparinase II/III family protein [Proteobacteria bacterium]|nr:heparinase II/III family protein [Pseudomonadota bacterium]